MMFHSYCKKRLGKPLAVAFPVNMSRLMECNSSSGTVALIDLLGPLDMVFCHTQISCTAVDNRSMSIIRLVPI